jgi:anti-anti-sigma factor
VYDRAREQHLLLVALLRTLAALATAEELGMTTGLQIVSRDGVVTLFGELDVVSRESFVTACDSCAGDDVVVDLSGLTFLDSSGYRAFVETRDQMSSKGRTLSLRHAVGEPARVLGFLRLLEPASAQRSG